MSPVPIGVARSPVVVLGIGVLHRPLVPLHLDPRPASGVEGAVDRDHDGQQHAAVAYYDAWQPNSSVINLGMCYSNCYPRSFA